MCLIDDFVFSTAPQCPTQSNDDLLQDIAHMVKCWQTVFADRKYMTKEMFASAGLVDNCRILFHYQCLQMPN
jgi:hypothetical protein